MIVLGIEFSLDADDLRWEAQAEKLNLWPRYGLIWEASYADCKPAICQTREDALFLAIENAVKQKKGASLLATKELQEVLLLFRKLKNAKRCCRKGKAAKT